MQSVKCEVSSGEQCHFGCLNNVCLDSGPCTQGCKASFTGDMCDVCLLCKGEACDDAGRCVTGCHYSRNYGVRCDRHCPDSCTECDRDFDNTRTCQSCSPGHYGIACEEQCPDDCLRDTCIKDNGDCASGCDTGYTGPKCIECDSGYYVSGSLCDKCPQYCDSCTNSTHCDVCESDHYALTCENWCPENCLNRQCDKVNGDCTHGCDTGFTGLKCNECAVGYYVSGKWCGPCPDNCESCTGINLCGSCKPGFFGSACTNACPEHCLNNVCDNVIGDCSHGCDTGYIGSKCVHCDTGFYMTGSWCGMCPKNCKSCTSRTVCDVCKPGYYGDVCANSCPGHCLNRLCDSVLGNCTNGCDTGYSGPKCTLCLEGYHMSESRWCFGCPVNCHSCTSDIKCETCKEGFYGTVCEHTCPEYCLNDLCDSTSGECVDGCDTGYTGSKCTDCEYGHYMNGTMCSKCPDNCQSCTDQGICDVITDSNGTDCGHECSGNSGNNKSSENNTTPVSNCGKDCSPNCEVGTCVNNGGVCNCSCKTGYVGLQCTQCLDNFYKDGHECYKCPTHCDQCSSNSSCTTCVSGYHGQTCDLLCSSGCNTTDCAKINGSCECRDGFRAYDCSQCTEGRAGNNCHTQCSDGCANRWIGIGATVGVVLTVGLAVFIVVLKRRRRRKAEDQDVLTLSDMSHTDMAMELDYNTIEEHSGTGIRQNADRADVLDNLVREDHEHIDEDSLYTISGIRQNADRAGVLDNLVMEDHEHIDEDSVYDQLDDTAVRQADCADSPYVLGRILES